MIKGVNIKCTDGEMKEILNFIVMTNNYQLPKDVVFIIKEDKPKFSFFRRKHKIPMIENMQHEEESIVADSDGVIMEESEEEEILDEEIIDNINDNDDSEDTTVDNDEESEDMLDDDEPIVDDEVQEEVLDENNEKTNVEKNLEFDFSNIPSYDELILTQINIESLINDIMNDEYFAKKEKSVEETNVENELLNKLERFEATLQSLEEMKDNMEKSISELKLENIKLTKNRNGLLILLEDNLDKFKQEDQDIIKMYFEET